MLDKLTDTTSTLGLVLGTQHLLQGLVGCSDYSTILAVAIILVARYAAGSQLWKRVSRSAPPDEPADRDDAD